MGRVRIINPLYSYFYFIMVFMSWKAFSLQASKCKPNVTIAEVDEEESPQTVVKPPKPGLFEKSPVKLGKKV